MVQKKIVLLGSNGQLGREWQHYLDEESAENYSMISYDSTQLDITRNSELKKVLDAQNPDIIINCAAYTNVDEAEEQREKALKVNAGAVKNLAELCRKSATKLVHYSTDYIFAGQKNDRDKFPDGYPEDHLAAPINYYGQTKWEGEKAIRNSGCKHIILRLSWLCGAYGNNFVTTMLRLAENHKQVRVVDDQLGSPAFTHNVVKNTLKLIELKREGTYHLTSVGLISWADFAHEIFKLSSKQVDVERIPSEEFPTEAKRPYFSKLNTGKIECVSGIEMEGWKKGLREMLNEM